MAMHWILSESNMGLCGLLDVENGKRQEMCKKKGKKCRKMCVLKLIQKHKVPGIDNAKPHLYLLLLLSCMSLSRGRN